MLDPQGHLKVFPPLTDNNSNDNVFNNEIFRSSRSEKNSGIKSIQIF